MNSAEQKVMQYLYEARVGERALTRELESQFAGTPAGSLRDLLAVHLDQTRVHAVRVGERLDSMRGTDRLGAILGLWEHAVDRAVAIARTPSVLLRGSGEAETALRNAQAMSAAEAREVAIYTTIEALARAVGDSTTAELAASILAEETEMYRSVMAEIPRLSQALYVAQTAAAPDTDASTTTAGEAIHEAAKVATDTASDATDAMQRVIRHSRRIPGVSAVEDQLRGLLASEQDLALAGYDELTVEEIVGQLAELSQSELTSIHSYERRHQKRSTILEQVERLRVSEPWTGYDELTATEIRRQLHEEHRDRADQVRDYERTHKDRSSVLTAAARALTKREA